MAKKKNPFAKSAEELRESRAASSTKYCEYAVHKDKTASSYLIRVAAIVVPTIVAIIAIMILSEVLGGGTGAQMVIGVAGAVLLAPIIFIGFALWRHSNIDYEYVICDGKMEMIKIIGGAKRKVLYRQKILDMEIIAPANGEWAVQYADYLDESKYDKVFRTCSSMTTPDLYFAVFEHEDFGKTLIYFNAIKKSVDIFRYHTKKTIVKPGII